jgi:two-component system alkaline phosphatase synthesis response regulator PhoP
MTNETKRVLVVDDDPNIFELVQLYVVADDVEVLQALDAYTGLDLVSRQDPDVIVLDIMMPGMDGLEMCQILRNSPDKADTPVVILSAKAKPEDIEAGYEAGADHYVTKPFEPEDLALLIEKIIS